MALPGEFHDSLEPIECEDCGSKLEVQVLRSNAGYYIGRFCDRDGPYERMSDYHPSEESAQAELDLWRESDVRPSARDIDFHG